MSAGSPRPTSTTTPRLVGLAAAGLIAVGAAGCGGGGGGGDDRDAEREVFTTDAGTVIVQTTSEKEGLHVEVQGSSLYVSATGETPADVLAGLKGKPLGGRCTLKDGRTVGTIQLLWREDPGDWGSSLEVQGVYDDEKPFAEVVRSCDLRQGESVGAGSTDVNAGPVLTTATFVED